MNSDPRWQAYVKAGLQQSLARICFDGSIVYTAGLERFGKPEIELDVGIPRLVKAGRDYLSTVLLDCREAAYKAGETVACGGWVLKLSESPAGRLQLHEYDPACQSIDALRRREATAFRHDAQFAIDMWELQTVACLRARSEFIPSPLNSLMRVSEGAFAAENLRCFRKPPDSTYCGWFITEERWDESNTPLRQYHTEHIVTGIPKVKSILCLEAGFEVTFTANRHALRFDHKLATAREI